MPPFNPKQRRHGEQGRRDDTRRGVGSRDGPGRGHPAGRDARAEETAHGRRFPAVHRGRELRDRGTTWAMSSARASACRSRTSRAGRTLLRLRYAYVDARRHHVTVLAAPNDFGATGSHRTGNACYHHPSCSGQPPIPWSPASAAPRCTSPRSGDADRRPTPPGTTAGTRGSETSHGALPWASGGGLSGSSPAPPTRTACARVAGNRRGVPDVSMSASLSGSVLDLPAPSRGPARLVHRRRNQRSHPGVRRHRRDRRPVHAATVSG